MGTKKTTSGFTADFGDLSQKAHDFGVRLKFLREKLGITQQGLAKKVGLSLTSIQNFEGGQFPRGEYAIKLAYSLGVSLDELLVGQPISSSGQQVTTACERCAKLETKLERLDEERRDLAVENRKLWKENSELIAKNGKLNTQVTKLEAEVQKPGIYKQDITQTGAA